MYFIYVTIIIRQHQYGMTVHILHTVVFQSVVKHILIALLQQKKNSDVTLYFPF